MYAIKWKNNLTGYVGRGDGVFDTYEQAQNICDKLNSEQSDIYHYVVKVESEVQNE